MTPTSIYKKQIFTGEIIELLDESGNKKAKIIMDKCFIEVLMDKNMEFHLGDKVKIETELKIKTIDLIIDKNQELFNTN